MCTPFKVDLQQCGNARGQSLYLENQRQDSQGTGDFIMLSSDPDAC